MQELYNFNCFMVLLFLLFSVIFLMVHSQKNRKFSFCLEKGTKRFCFHFFAPFLFCVFKFMQNFLLSFRGRRNIKEPSVKKEFWTKATTFYQFSTLALKYIFEYNNRNNWMYTNTFTWHKWSFWANIYWRSIIFHIITEKGVERTFTRWPFHHEANNDIII